MASREEADFMALENAERRSLLEEVAGQLPIFLPGLLFQTYSNYYQHPRVLEALGLAARPPYPIGHDLELGDMGLLDREPRSELSPEHLGRTWARSESELGPAELE